MIKQTDEQYMMAMKVAREDGDTFNAILIQRLWDAQRELEGAMNVVIRSVDRNHRANKKGNEPT